jgi:5'-nucleotidase
VGVAIVSQRLWTISAFLLLTGCTANNGGSISLKGEPVELTLIHTADIHSRLYPYDFDPSFTDQQLGLDPDFGPFGGIARIATIAKEQRAKAHRVLHLDSGDSFEGAVVFNQFDGEAEFRSLTEVGLDGAVLANHEFDKGAFNLAQQADAWAGFPILAANYEFEDADLPYASELADLIQPTHMYDLDGLRVGVIGLGNLSSLNSIYDESNSMGIKVHEIGEVIPAQAETLKEEGADLIIVLSHMGLEVDQEIAKQFPQVDLILGGHNHIALDPPLVVTNEVTGKQILICHSGAFAKFVGRLDLVVQDGQILSHDYTLFPVDKSVPEDPAVAEIMQEYKEQLDYDYNLNQILGYANSPLTRYGSVGGDSMLGNFAAEAMRSYPGVETEIALTNTLGIRSDIPAGNITLDGLFNAMPFDNTITTMFLSGREVQELLDYVSSRSSERGCNAQAQVAGLSFDMDCNEQVAKNIKVNGVALDPDGTYELATNNYIAHGGSGFKVLERNTTQVDTGISIRDVVKEAITRYQTLPQPDADVCVEDGRINPVY